MEINDLQHGMQLVTICKFEFTELIDSKKNGLIAAFLVNAACLSRPSTYSLTTIGRTPPFLLVYDINTYVCAIRTAIPDK